MQRPIRKRLKMERVAIAIVVLLLLPALALLYFYWRTPHQDVAREKGEAPQLDFHQAYPAGTLAKGLMFDRLLLEKKQHRLTAFSKGKAVRVYLVALGSNPTGPKEFEGDRRTPEGKYIIDGKESKSHYYRAIAIPYPNRTDRERAPAVATPPCANCKIHGLAEHYAVVGQAHR